MLSPAAHHQQVRGRRLLENGLFGHTDIHAPLHAHGARLLRHGAQIVQRRLRSFPVQAKDLRLKRTPGDFTPQGSESLDGRSLHDAHVDHGQAEEVQLEAMGQPHRQLRGAPSIGGSVQRHQDSIEQCDTPHCRWWPPSTRIVSPVT